MLNVFHRYPFCRLLLPFLGGIVAAYHPAFNIVCRWYIPLIFLCLALVIYGISIQLNTYSRRWMFGFALTGLCFVSACWLTNQKLSDVEWQIPADIQLYHAQLIEEPLPKPQSLMCRMHLLEAKRDVLIYLRTDSGKLPEVGDWLAVTVQWKAPANFSPDFDYATYLKNQGIAAVAYADRSHWKMIPVPKHIFPDFKTMALRCRKYWMGRLQWIVQDSRHYAVATALLLGYKGNMDTGLKKQFAATGASHILAVSGLHVSMIYAVLYGISSFCNRGVRSNRIRHLLLLLAMWIFAFITGLSPSVVRATLMLSVVSAGSMLGEKSLSLNALSASALFMLIYNPLYLLDVGFQLSYAAVAAIVIINPLLNRFYSSDNRIIQYGWNLITVSTSAQLGTLPLTLYYFHQFPTLFLLTNLFVIPLSAILLGVLLGTLMLDVLLPLPAIFYLPVNLLLNCFVSGIQWIEQIPGVLAEGIFISELTLWISYVVLCLLILTVVYRRVIYVYIAALLVAYQVIYYL